MWHSMYDDVAAAAKGGQFLEIAELEGDLYGTSVQAGEEKKEKNEKEKKKTRQVRKHGNKL